MTGVAFCGRYSSGGQRVVKGTPLRFVLYAGRRRDAHHMTHVRVLIVLLLAVTFCTPAQAVLSAEDVLRVQMQSTPKGQAPRQGQVLEGSQLVRPSARERDAVSQLLATKPRPKTLKDADIKYLNDLLNKAAWVGFERRIVHEMWTEVSGKEWYDTEVSHPPKNEQSP